MKTTNTIIVPLLNASPSEVLEKELPATLFRPLTVHIPETPIQVFPKAPPDTGIPSGPPKTKDILLPPPVVTIKIQPRLDAAAPDPLPDFPGLPSDFDEFSEHVHFAFRAGPGGGGGHRTSLMLGPKRRADSILSITLTVEYPDDAPPEILQFVAHEFQVTEALLQSLTLYSLGSIRYRRGYQATNDQTKNIVLSWPCQDQAGQDIPIGNEELENIVGIFQTILPFVFGSKTEGSRAVQLAMEHFQLAVTLDQTVSKFLFFWICLETLLSVRSEDAQGACKRLAEVVSESRIEKKQNRDFLLNLVSVRNQIVHGDYSTLSSEATPRLSHLLRVGILTIAQNLNSGKLDAANYRRTLATFTNRLFQERSTSKKGT